MKILQLFFTSHLFGGKAEKDVQARAWGSWRYFLAKNDFLYLE